MIDPPISLWQIDTSHDNRKGLNINSNSDPHLPSNATWKDHSIVNLWCSSLISSHCWVVTISHSAVQAVSWPATGTGRCSQRANRNTERPCRGWTAICVCWAAGLFKVFHLLTPRIFSQPLNVLCVVVMVGPLLTWWLATTAHCSSWPSRMPNWRQL